MREEERNRNEKPEEITREIRMKKTTKKERKEEAYASTQRRKNELQRQPLSSPYSRLEPPSFCHRRHQHHQHHHQVSLLPPPRPYPPCCSSFSSSSSFSIVLLVKSAESLHYLLSRTSSGPDQNGWVRSSLVS
jgi:hypothetical protein